MLIYFFYFSIFQQPYINVNSSIIFFVVTVTFFLEVFIMECPSIPHSFHFSILFQAILVSKYFFPTFRMGQRQISVKSRRFDVIHDIHIPASLLSICITVLCILYVAIFIIFNVFHDTFFTFTPPEVTSLASKQPLCGLRSFFHMHGL